MITELRDFYLVQDKLLYVCKDFIGFNPVISNGLTHHKTNSPGTRVKVDEFEMRDTKFSVILTSFFDHGPLKGYKRIEILRNDRLIICYERGTKGYGRNYSKGNYFLVENNNAFLVAEGYAMVNLNTKKILAGFNRENYYFFWFDNITIPKQYERDFERKDIQIKEIYHKQEVESLRQIDWEAYTTFNNTNLHIRRTSIPGFFQSLWRPDGHEEFIKNSNSEALGKTEITTNNSNSNEQQNSR